MSVRRPCVGGDILGSGSPPFPTTGEPRSTTPDIKRMNRGEREVEIGSGTIDVNNSVLHQTVQLRVVMISEGLEAGPGNPGRPNDVTDRVVTNSTDLNPATVWHHQRDKRGMSERGKTHGVRRIEGPQRVRGLVFSFCG